ncbi:hypothetical protein TRFO_32232 [Tritrichomonas foetus]|uniref:adenylate cyclase n=1 Tax=Tritrichomonas foetus TaxID=1144522 RepID=A0A1J4JP58_9EUKA|nr:hypothetical protein TRFO_32232 [Tritrichomonas foetus]|eukprot:OHT00935.1 hypothetical protein TRFO_32232 [Tritrichomonas foetus]
MDWTNWEGLEHWYYFNHFGHFFNSSRPLPSILYSILNIIIFIQVIPIFSSFILVSTYTMNPIIESLAFLCKIIIYLYFIPHRVMSILLFLLMILFSTFVLVASPLKSGRMLKNSMVTFVRIMTEILCPIFLIWSAATVQRISIFYLDDKSELPFLVIAIITTIGLFVLFLMVSYFTSRTMFMRDFYFETWNTTHNLVLVLGGILDMQCWIFQKLYSTKGAYISLGIAMLFNLIICISSLQLPYLQSTTNTMAIILIFFFVLLHILHFVVVQFPDFDYYLHNLMITIILIISIVLGPILHNYMISLFLDVYLKYDEREMELEALDNPSDDFHHLNETFHFRLSKFDTVKLRQLFLCDKRKAEKFANFLLNNSTNTNDILESYRILNILQNPPSQRIIEHTTYKFDSAQLLCDLQYDAIARTLPDEAIETLIDHLNAKSLTIKRNISAIIDCIQMTNKNDAFNMVKNYSKECNEYEMLASFFLVHAPYSPQITHEIATYFNILRGDMEQSQTWLQNTDGLKRTSSSYSGYRSRLSVNLSSAKLSELNGLQRFNSQRALQKVTSNAYRGSIIFFACTFIIAMVCIFYDYDPSTIAFVISDMVSSASVQLSTFALAPLYNLFVLMADILSDCTPSNSKKFENLFNHVIIPFNSGVGQIITALELITKALRSINFDHKTQLQSYDEFTVTPVKGADVSLQMLMNQIYKLSETAPKGKCQFKYLQFVNEFMQKISFSFDPLLNLKESFFDYSFLSIDRYQKNHLRDFIILSVYLIVFLFIGFCYVEFAALIERKRFWTVFTELDGSDLDKYQKSLLQVQNKVDNSIFDLDPNLLAPDEVESPETDRLILTNELIPLPKPKKQFNSFPLATVITLILFLTVMFLYQYPIKSTLFLEIDLDNVSHLLQKIIIQHTYKVIEHTNRALYTAVPISTSLLENKEDLIAKFEDTYDFIDLKPYLDKRYTFFKDANEFLIELKNVRIESLIYGEKWFVFSLDDNYFNMVWLAFNNITGLSNQISEWYFDKHQELNTIRTIFSHSSKLILAILLIIYFHIILFKLKSYKCEFESLKSLVLILPSPYFLSTANIIEAFKRHSSQKVGSGRFQSRYIIKHSVNPIIVIDSNRLIQDANMATVELFGYKRDLLIRSDLKSLFDVNDTQSEDFFAQINFINDNNTQNLPTREFNLFALAQDGSKIPVNTILIQISDSENTDSPAFAVMLRDRTDFLKQDEEYRSMQHQVESLLLRIMPKVMVTKLLSNNQDLHFQVDRATFIFIGIINFNQWCKIHTHTEIMELLDIIVSVFDKKISYFKSLVKIKIINGTYMAAGGLFKEVSEKPHEVEMVEFALKCLKWMNKRNILAQTNIQLQIGINTGGPIIAGILGRDKPLFDVYGDAVNVAARLETSASSNEIQISEETAGALPEGMCTMRKRDHVMLKGKGEASTYIITIDRNRRSSSLFEF